MATTEVVTGKARAKYETRKQTRAGKQSTLERKQRRREKYQTTQLTDHKGYRARILGGAR